MIGKGANTIRPATLAEVEKILDKRQGVGGGEFGFEQQTSLEYAKRFSHLKYNDAMEMVEELGKLEIKPETAVKIVDLLPSNKSQLMLVLSKDKLELSEKKMSQLEGIIASYSKKAKKFEPRAEPVPDAAPAEPAAADDGKAEKGKEKKPDHA
jgi:DNA-directed RNA polymerase subunit F